MKRRGGQIPRHNVRDVLFAYRDGERVQSIADRFGCAKSYVSMVVTRFGAEYGIELRQKHRPRVDELKDGPRPSRLAAQAKRKREKREAAGRRQQVGAERGCAAAALANRSAAVKVTLPTLRWGSSL